MTARGIRNKNPGNLEQGESWQGLAENQSDSRFCVFKSMEYININQNNFLPNIFILCKSNWNFL